VRDLIAALGLALVVEGVLFAAFPEAVRRALIDAARSPRERMRIVGVASAGAGLVVVWLARHTGA
jgi:hypothetical protein